ncbi:Zn(2)-C6 fungal-type DNA-binding domain protein [Metarhizium brunneum]
MADFLASFNFGTDNEVAPNDGACASLDHLQGRLRALIEAKTTATRAEHVNTTVDVAGTAEFAVDLTQGDKDNMNNVDPLLSGGAEDTDRRHEGQTHVYTAMDVLRDQPSQAPVVQKAVAEQIARAAGVEDKSVWVLHSFDSAAHGWDFTFICEQSVQHWKAQNEGKTKDIVGEYTKKEPDPVLMSRPAFDCRGRLLITFSRKARTISVKYNHTIMHKSVADLTELFKPPPMIGPQKPDKKTLAKAAKLAQEEAAKVRRKKNTEHQRGQDGEPKGQRRRRNKKAAGETQQAHLSLVEQAAQALDHADMSRLGEAVAAMNNDDDGHGSAVGWGTNPSAGSAIKPLSLNVTPEEAARRKDVATKLLTEAGVSPDSLSTDQLNIFANQAPELQKESLNMLVTYGAQRLQIIHPSNKESSAPVPQSDVSPSGEGAASGARTTTTELVLEDSTPKGKRKRSSRLLGKSRLSCFTCKKRRVRCPRERPTCSECQDSQVECHYPPQPSRKPKQKSDALATDDADADAEADDDNVEGEADETVMTEANANDTSMTETNANTGQQEAPQDDNDFSSDPGAPYSYPQIPGPDLVRDSAHDLAHSFHQQPTQAPYFQSASGLALPQPDPLDDAPRSQLNNGMTLSESSAYYPSYPPPEPAPVTEPQREPEERQPVEPNIHTSNHRRQASNNTRTNTNTQKSSWAQQHGNDMFIPTVSQASPLLQHGYPVSQSPDLAPAAAHINMEDAALLTHAATHNQSYAPNSSMRIHRPTPPQPKSPFLPPYHSRSASQQSHRSSGMMPHSRSSAFQAPPPPPPPAAAAAAADTHSNIRYNNVQSRSSIGGLPTARYGSSDGVDSSNKIGYKPYSYQKSGSSAGTSNHGYQSQSFHSTMKSSGMHGSLAAYAGLRPGQGTPGDRQDHRQGQHGQHGQHAQNWQGESQGNGFGQSQRHGYNWGMGEGWNQGHNQGH